MKSGEESVDAGNVPTRRWSGANCASCFPAAVGALRLSPSQRTLLIRLLFFKITQTGKGRTAHVCLEDKLKLDRWWRAQEETLTAD